MLEKTVDFDQRYAEELAKSGKIIDGFIKLGEAAGIAYAVWHLRNWQSKNPPNNGIQPTVDSPAETDNHPGG
jgi:hypothetical protein